MRRRLFVLLSAIFLLVTSREPPWADAHVAYDTAQAMVDRGELGVELQAAEYFFTRHNGRKYDFHTLGNAVALIPSYLAFQALAGTRLFPQRPLFAFTSHLSSALLMAGACALFFGLCRRRGAGEGLALLLSLGLGLCTICLVYARSPYAEALQTLALLLLVERTLRAGDDGSPWQMATLGAAAGLLLHAKLNFALVLPACGLYIAYRRRHHPAGLLRGAAISLLAFLPFLALVLLHNWVKTGSVLDSGHPYAGDIFSGDPVAGVFGLLLSPGKGMFLYSPPLILSLAGLFVAWRHDRAETLLLLSLAALVLVPSALFLTWHGDYCWGPRYLVPITPIILLLAVPWLPAALERGRRRLRAALLCGLLVLGLCVQLLGASLYWDHYIRIMVSVKEQTGMRGWSQHHLPHAYFIPYFSPVRGHLWLLRHVLMSDPDLARDPPWRTLVAGRVDLAPHYAALRVDWWALDWLRGPRPGQLAGGAILGLLALLALAAGAGLRPAHGPRRPGAPKAASRAGLARTPV